MHEMSLRPEPQTVNMRTYDNHRSAIKATDCSRVVHTLNRDIDRFHQRKGEQRVCFLKTGLVR